MTSINGLGRAENYLADAALRESAAGLSESEEKYRTLFNSMDEGYCIIKLYFDADGVPYNWRYEEVNPAFEKNNGLVNATGKTILELTPAIEPKWFDIYGQVARTGEPLRFEEYSAAFQRWFNLYAFRIGDPAAQLVAVLFTDITLRKQTEEALRVSDSHRLEETHRRTQQRALFNAVLDAREAERRRIAEALHNGVGQLLYAVKLRLDQLSSAPLSTGQALARREAEELLGTAIRQTRSLSHELVPVVLAEFGLVVALRDICYQLTSRQLRFDCSIDADDKLLPPMLQLALYRIAQELALNIIKHAQATEATLALETVPGFVLLRAEDNGIGFPQEGLPRTGLGLRSIQDHVTLLDGRLELGSAPQVGTYVRLRIPLLPGART